jgi:hypothetical protein
MISAALAAPANVDKLVASNAAEARIRSEVDIRPSPFRIGCALARLPQSAVCPTLSKRERPSEAVRDWLLRGCRVRVSLIGAPRRLPRDIARRVFGSVLLLIYAFLQWRH